MLEIILANLGTIIIFVCLAAVITGVVVYLVNNRKKGKTSCGCGCSNCALRDTCHSKSQK
ncbi:MAG: FeoB-associated Cys-rich membrane protein [Eubacteriales bacterium]|nr:FeoB-associated Cys-rich membrane protein [Eubacteriales bacterium]